MPIKLYNEYVEFVKDINKYNPKTRDISLILALVSECYEVAVSTEESVDDHVLELGDLMWCLVAIGSSGCYGVDESLIFNCIETGSQLSTRRRLKYLNLGTKPLNLHPLIILSLELIDNINKLKFKNFFVQNKKVYSGKIHDVLLEIATIAGAMVSEIDVTINDVLERNITKLKAQIGKVRKPMIVNELKQKQVTNINKNYALQEEINKNLLELDKLENDLIDRLGKSIKTIEWLFSKVDNLANRWLLWRATDWTKKLIDTTKAASDD